MDANVEEFLEMVGKRNPPVDDKFLRLVNLRAGTTESDIRDFFVGKKKYFNRLPNLLELTCIAFVTGLLIEKVYIIYENSGIKEAYVKFCSSDDADVAIKRSGELLRNKYDQETFYLHQFDVIY